MDSEAQYILVGDIGGTNARFQLWQPPVSGKEDIKLIFGKTNRVAEAGSVGELLGKFLSQSEENVGKRVIPVKTVLGICGPVVDEGRSGIPSNMKKLDGTKYGPAIADEIEESLGLPKHSLTFVNDFEAIGYSLAALYDDSVGDACKAGPIYTLHEGKAAKAKVVACVGAGTGLGCCFLTPMCKSGQKYNVHPSEGGMVDSFRPKTELERKILQWLIAKSGDKHIEIERLVSGPGLVTLFRFFEEQSEEASVCATHIEIKSALNSKLTNSDFDEHPAIISEFAQQGHKDCQYAIDLFLTVYGRALGSAALTFLPGSGLYIAGGILPKLRWRWSQEENEDNENLLLSAYLSQGCMSSVIADFPLKLVEDDSAGIKGALYVALSQLREQ